MAHAYYSELAFPGLLEGKPSKRMIDERITSAKKLAAAHSGGLMARLFRRIPMEKHVFHEKNHPSDDFPTHYCVADLVSYNATDDRHMMSHLTISWFMTFDDKDGYVASIQAALSDFPWDRHALSGDW